MSMAVREAANDGAAEVLKEELYQQRISERELARRMEVSQSWLNKRLTGEIPLRFGEVFEIASLLKIPLERFSNAVANVTAEGRVRKTLSSFLPLHLRFPVFSCAFACGAA